MKKTLTLLFAIILALILLACNSDSEQPTVPVVALRLDQTSARLLIGDTLRITATVFPENATNPDIIWISENPNIATVSSGIVTALAIGDAVITAMTVDGGHTQTCAVTVATPIPMTGCNFNTPGWGETLGIVSFHSTNTWTIEGRGVTQVWSDAVTASNCQKTAFAGATNVDGLNADCRSNPNAPGDFFSWCAVVRFADKLCPYPWRVPTLQDFSDLDRALGGLGVGHNRNDLQFVNQNYISLWGGVFGGSSWSNGNLQSLGSGLYWSQTDFTPQRGRNLSFGTNGRITPGDHTEKGSGLSVRCVK